MEVGSIVRWKGAGFIGIVLETGINVLGKPRARVQWPTHYNHIMWVDQTLVELVCE